MTIIANIPEYLQKYGLFCLWKRETDENGRMTKVPYNPNTHTHGKSNDRSTFAPLNIAASRADGYDGLGIGIFDGIAAIDIDHCLQDGELSAMAADIVETMDTYTEISPSGEGLRIVFLAPGFQYDRGKYYINNQKKGLEIYLPGMTNKYVTITGDTLRRQDTLNRADRLQTILDKYMMRPQQEAPAAPMPAVPMNISDTELIEKAKNAANGMKFAELWDGELSGYKSQSEADQALCNLLAFWTGRDASRIDALFRQSGLMRPKWDRKQSGTTYGAITIQNAIANCKEVYTNNIRGAFGWNDAIDTDWMPPDITESAQGHETAAGDAEYTEAQKTPQEAPQTQITAFSAFDSFMEKIQTEAYKPMQTGMPALDKLLGGGILRQSLVILSSAPGYGKTAFAAQIFEEMAKQGTDVIFMNLEMSREQLLARSLARICYKQGRKGISAADILKGYIWKNDPLRRAYITQAAEEYRNTIAERMMYNPGGKGTNLEYIMSILETCGAAAQQANKPAPVVVLDYLHLITTEKREEQGELLKKAVARLKDYAIRYDTFVFAISANNRIANSSGIISLESGRDTSAIEYSADVQLSLNYAALADKRKKSNGEYYKASDPDDMAKLQAGDANGNREMKVQVLKNRLNEAGGKLYLAFNPASGSFFPIDKHAEPPGYIANDEDIPFL